MMYLYGMRVIESPYVNDAARFELGPGVRQFLTPEYLAQFDIWSRSFFGIKPTIYKAQDPAGDVLIVSPYGYEILCRAAPKEYLP
jgi:hypothetical protein